jgi:hypothetical protein
MDPLGSIDYIGDLLIHSVIPNYENLRKSFLDPSGSNVNLPGDAGNVRVTLVENVRLHGPTSPPLDKLVFHVRAVTENCTAGLDEVALSEVSREPAADTPKLLRPILPAALNLNLPDLFSPSPHLQASRRSISSMSTKEERPEKPSSHDESTRTLLRPKSEVKSEVKSESEEEKDEMTDLPTDLASPRCSPRNVARSIASGGGSTTASIRRGMLGLRLELNPSLQRFLRFAAWRIP